MLARDLLRIECVFVRAFAARGRRCLTRMSAASSGQEEGSSREEALGEILAVRRKENAVTETCKPEMLCREVGRSLCEDEDSQQGFLSR